MVSTPEFVSGNALTTFLDRGDVGFVPNAIFVANGGSYTTVQVITMLTLVILHTWSSEERRFDSSHVQRKSQIESNSPCAFWNSIRRIELSKTNPFIEFFVFSFNGFHLSSGRRFVAVRYTRKCAVLGAALTQKVTI